MGAIRKPRFSDCDVEKAMDGFFNNLLEYRQCWFRSAIDKLSDVQA
jgi:hypothetical protein